MRPLPDLELLRPATAADAVLLLRRDGTRAIAGGTDLLPNLRRGLGSPPALVDVSGIADFAKAGRDAHGWRLGAGVTLARLAADAAVAHELPALAQAAASVAGPGHRAVATPGQARQINNRGQIVGWMEPQGFAEAFVASAAGSAERLSPDGRWAAAILTSPPEVVLYPTGTGTSRRIAGGRFDPVASVQWKARYGSRRPIRCTSTSPCNRARFSNRR